MKFKILGH